ncbi:MAG: BRCT domain-containing protein, partial [Huintestinicola sp.]
KEDTANYSDFYTSPDPNHKLFGKKCVITGALVKFSKNKAASIIQSIGGEYCDNVTKKTDYLFVADEAVNMQTNKLCKAIQYSEKGIPIQIISESGFYSLLENKDVSEMEQLTFDEITTSVDENITIDIKSKVLEIVNTVCSSMNIGTEVIFIDEIAKGDKFSLWILEPMKMKKKCLRILTIYEKKNKVKVEISSKRTYDLPAVESDKINSSNARVLTFDTSDSLLWDCVSEIITEDIKSYRPIERFGCCDLYEKCSDARKCLHDNLFYAKACWYRKNLEKGKIFYGKNKNV